MDKLEDIITRLTATSTAWGIVLIITSTTLNIMFTGIPIFILSLILYMGAGYQLLSKDG
jgi:hypothetical protein